MMRDRERRFPRAFWWAPFLIEWRGERRAEMTVKIEVPEVVREFRRRLEALYGERLRDVILYGSYARGDADEGSDIDVLVVLDAFADEEAELRRMDPIANELSLEHDVVISNLVVRESDYAHRDSLLLLNVRREGIEV
jgi:predicted nucleotidyltransferase